MSMFSNFFGLNKFFKSQDLNESQKKDFFNIKKAVNKTFGEFTEFQLKKIK